MSSDASAVEGRVAAVPSGDGQSVELVAPVAPAAQPEPSPSPSPSEEEEAEVKKKKLAATLSSTGQALPTLQDYISYVRMLYSDKCWRDAPSVDITYDNLSYILDLPVDDVTNPSIDKAFLDMFRPKKTTKFDVFSDLAGHIPAGKMTLVLAPPGAGKSAFLKTLGGHMRNNKSVTGELLYDGLSSAEQLSGGVFTEKLCALVAQGDVHMANLTVRETLQFALDNAVVPPTAELFGQQQLDPKLIQYHKDKVNLLLSVLGMHECADTIAGNDMIRGISGGQRKRLTIGELMITNARVLLLDEPTTGLDAAVSRDVMVVLREWCQVSGGTVIAALLQATPECYELYDDLILMREGKVLYHGPRVDVAQFMEQSWGLVAPDDMDIADFIIEVLTNPLQQFHKQQRAHAKGKVQRKFPLEAALPKELAPYAEKEKSKANGAANGAANGHANGHAGNYLASPVSPGPAAAQSVSVVRFHVAAEEDEPLPNGAGANGVHSSQLSLASSSGVALSGEEAAAAVVPAAGTEDALPLLARNSSQWPVTTDAMLSGYKHSSYYLLQRAAVERVQNERSAKVTALKAAKRTPYTLAQYGSLYTRGFITHTRLSLGRQFTLLSRDKQTVPPRAFSAILQSLIFGSLFWNLSSENFYPKIGILLFSIMFFAMGNFTELPATFEGRNAVYKQVDAGMFPPLSYAISIFLAGIPITLLESFLYSIILYFMIGLASDAGRFFFFWFCMILADLLFGTGFRAICYRVVAIDQAQQWAMPIMNIMMIYSGFLILKDEIKDWQIEFYWLSPFAWIVRTICLNEFNDGTYSDPPPDPDATETRRGDFYLHNFGGMPTDNAYKWGGVGYLLGCCALFTWAGSYWLRTVRFDLLQGTKRVKPEEAAGGTTAVGAPLDVAVASGGVLAQPANAVAAKPPTAQGSDVLVQVQPVRAVPEKRLKNMSSASSQVPINSVLPFQPASFAFEHISYSVTVTETEGPRKGKTYDKQLLQDVSGYVKPGQLVALMGSSGAGKTTLIDAIAGRKTSGKLDGNIFVNGQKKGEIENMFKRITGYVEQRDMHMPLATVRESLMFSAKLRLPRSVTDDQRREFVEELLDILELKHLGDRIVGNEKYAGLSPGQLKLLTIGVELAANPSILFLDEPTSGLDSRAAVVVMRVVSKIAATGRSVLCTIHQPSSDVFFFFDSMLLLRSGGRAVFFGELGAEAKNLVAYFEGIPNESGVYPRIPEGQNPASWMLDVIGAGLSGSLKRATARKKHTDAEHAEEARPFDYADVYAQSELCSRQMAELQTVAHPAQRVEIAVQPEEYNIPLRTQLRCVVSRGFTSYWRDSYMNFGRLMMLIIISLIFGIVYVQLDEGTYAGLTSKTSAIFSIAGFLAMLSAQTTLPSIFGERAVYYRETSSNAYPSWIYSTTTGLCEIPYVFVSSLFGIIIFYFMVGYENDAALFFEFWCAISMLVLIESSFGQLAAAALPNFVVAIQLAGALNTLFFLFGGLFIRPADIPTGWQWFYYMNPIPKSIIAIVLPQFQCHPPDGVDPYDVLSGCPTIKDPVTGEMVTTHAYVQDQWMSSYDNVFGRMIGWLVLTYAVFRLGIFLSFRYINHLKR